MTASLVPLFLDGVGSCLTISCAPSFTLYLKMKNSITPTTVPPARIPKKRNAPKRLPQASAEGGTGMDILSLPFNGHLAITLACCYIYNAIHA